MEVACEMDNHFGLGDDSRLSIGEEEEIAYAVQADRM